MLFNNNLVLLAIPLAIIIGILIAHRFSKPR